MFKDHEVFVRDMEEKGGMYGEELLRRLFTEIKREIPKVIDSNRKTPKGVASPVGYVQGKLGRSVRFRVRKWERKSGGASVQGYLYVGEGLAYARIHDYNGSKTIEAKTPRGLVFFNHVTKTWAGMGPVKVHKVERPGSPYFDEAVNYSMRKLGL
jgi:hypothetical protein